MHMPTPVSGKIGQINHGNGAMTRYSYDAWSGRLTGLVSASPANTPATDYQTKAYTYYPSGDIQTITDYKTNVTLTYTYDALHRLIAETNNGGLPPMTLTYDALGNILTKTVGVNTMVYEYHPSKKHAVSKVTFNGVAYNFVYDANGNMTTGYDFTVSTNIGTRTMTYDEDNNLANIVYVKGGQTATASMIYDETGERVRKTGNVATYYVGDHFEVQDGVVARHITAGNQKLAVIQGNDIYYFHKDHLGSSAAMSNAAGAVVETTDYMPFGAVRSFTGNAVTNYRYTGQELDPESGLYYYKSRYYDNVLARFISADSIYPDLYNPQALNGYSYCDNNPLIYVDPSGHSVEPAIAIVAIVTAIVIGAVAGGAQSNWHGDAVLVGALSGGICAAVAIFVPYAGPILAGAIGGGINSAFYGGNMLDAMLSGALIGAATMVASYVIGWTLYNMTPESYAVEGAMSGGAGRYPTPEDMYNRDDIILASDNGQKVPGKEPLFKGIPWVKQLGVAGNIGPFEVGWMSNEPLKSQLSFSLNPGIGGGLLICGDSPSVLAQNAPTNFSVQIGFGRFFGIQTNNAVTCINLGFSKFFGPIPATVTVPADGIKNIFNLF